MNEASKISPIRSSVKAPDRREEPVFLMNPRQLRDPAEGGRETVDEALGRVPDQPAARAPDQAAAARSDKKAA